MARAENSELGGHEGGHNFYGVADGKIDMSEIHK